MIYKLRNILIGIVVFSSSYSAACPVCEKQQPAITQGLTHGAGPQSNWDWVIIALMVLITIFTLVYSLKYLIKPNEKGQDHIKQTILN